MKKMLAMLLTGTMIFSLTACGNANAAEAESTETTNSSETAENVNISDDTSGITPSGTEEASVHSENENGEYGTGGVDETNILIAYFSRADENYRVGVIEKGNTEIIAEMIAEQTGGDLFHIETVTPYPESYDECTEVAQQELRDNARPELSGTVDQFEEYDVIFLGYPNWWGDMPMAVYTFLESYDFTGKIIVPFVTHEGSGLASTERSIADICFGAEVLEGLAVRGSVAQNSQDEAREAVIGWLQEVGFAE